MNHKRNQGMDASVILEFVSSAYVGVVENWLEHENRIPHPALAEQLGRLLERVMEE